MSDELPRTFEEAIAWAKTRAGETGEMATTIANPTAGLVFDLKNATITHTVFDEDNNIIEMTYCACPEQTSYKAHWKQADLIS